MKTILLIEDDLFMRDITSQKLAKEGYSVVAVPSAGAACDELVTKQFDLIILDLDLPGKHGSVFLKELKEGGDTENIPVIVFSNDDTPEIEMSCITAGADAFFVKINTDIDVLQKKIGELLGTE